MIYFFLLVLLYIYFIRRRYSSKLFYLGLILFTTDITLFTFSRIALFEIPLSFFLYAMILPLSQLNEDKKASIIPAVCLLIGGLAMAFTIKLSSLVYIFPLLAAASIYFIINNDNINKKQFTLFATILLIAIFVTLAITYNVWSARIGVSLLLYIYHVIENPLLVTSPFILIASTLCAAHAITYQFDCYFNNLYRLSLIFMVISAPLLLSMFAYHPLRYFVPFVPAYILLIIEWFSTTPIEATRKAVNYMLNGFGLLLLVLVVMYSFTALSAHEHIQMRFLIIIGAVISFVLWGLRHYLFSNRIIISAIAVMVFLSVIQNIYFIGSFITKPSYHANTMRTRLSEIVKDDDIIAGGWAPFLTLGTPIRVLYSNTLFNPPDVLTKIRPEYFVLSESPSALASFEILKADENILVAPPLELGTYNKTNVWLYPLSYITVND